MTASEPPEPTEVPSPDPVTMPAGGPLAAPPPEPVRVPRRRWRWVVGVVVALVAVWLAAFGVATALAGDDTPRNLVVAGVNVGGLSPADLDARLDQVAAGYETTPVDVVTPAGTVTTDASTAGLSLDAAATAASTLNADDDIPAVLRPFAWLRSLVFEREVTPTMTVDAETLAASPVGELPAKNSEPPVEPGLVADGAALSATEGEDGTDLTLEQVAVAMVAAAESQPTGPLRITVEPSVIPPTYTLADAQELANETNAKLSEPITLQVGPVSVQVDGLTLAGWLTTAAGPDRLVLAVDPFRAGEGIGAIAGEVGNPEEPARLVVENGAVTTVGGRGATRCCDPASFQRIALALSTPERVALVDLVEEPLVRGPEWAAALGITTPVGSFTTQFPAGQSRNTNIIRIAEILQGTVIEPGTTFSVNGTTGPRDVPQGFVEGGIIVNGKVVSGVGGGISQFATTLFNAAFFAGLDIPDYTMHSLYISRYPYGREATLFYPSVDLKITNNTPYGILVWPTWTDESITVTLYSTPWVVGEETGQVTEPAGVCTRVITQRTRTWLEDNRKENDYFRALYQPEEGVRC